MISNIVNLTYLLLTLATPKQSPMVGAWETKDDDGNTISMIITDDYFSVAGYKESPAEFVFTLGGSWSMEGNMTNILYEFNTLDKSLVGTSDSFEMTIMDNKLTGNGLTWTRVDKGKPGKLQGAWLITGRKRDGEISMRTPGARKTMKILSGTRFQWIAFNSETGEFSGTGGGTYTTKSGRYTENIEFFSRDNSRAGAELGFDYSLEAGSWHHSGLSSTGNPIYEVWETRESLGI
ncbi:MAG: membrane or secreted protein [Bacteroidota bacterium]